ncbi:MAG: hypothetical protein ACKPKO_59610, partial [Candidatus Fonsibacter sp.]
SMHAEDKCVKKDKWCSDKEVLQKKTFDEHEFHKRLNSGRILWREDPWTAGVYQCKEQGDFTRKVEVAREKTLNISQ